ncbi:MAG: SRPBCC family protein [Halobacteriota archaeon]|nr:SRPBCC family protein [Halobacteriota archaeon]
MTRFEISITINKPADIVTEALNNPENFPYWQTDLEKFEVVKGEPNQVGSVGRLHYSQKGKSYIMEDKLIYCEPGKRYISEVSGDAITAKVETTLDSSGDKTKMSLQWEGKGKILVLKLLLPFLRGKIIKQAKTELETFKQLVEERGPNFSK